MDSLAYYVALALLVTAVPALGFETGAGLVRRVLARD